MPEVDHVGAMHAKELAGIDDLAMEFFQRVAAGETRSRKSIDMGIPAIGLQVGDLTRGNKACARAVSDKDLLQK